MPAVHENVKQWAGEKKQKRQSAEEMGAMFGDQVKPGNREKSDKHNIAPRPKIAWC